PRPSRPSPTPRKRCSRSIRPCTPGSYSTTGRRPTRGVCSAAATAIAWWSPGAWRRSRRRSGSRRTRSARRNRRPARRLPRIWSVGLDFLAGHAESLPDKPAVIDGDRVLDFASLNRRASRVANLFTRLGCQEGERVAWMSFNSLEGAEIASGLRRAGLVIVPVNYRLRGAEIAYILNDSGAKVAAAGPDHTGFMAEGREAVQGDVTFVTTAPNGPGGWLRYADLMAEAGEDFTSVSDALGASMIYTSGTTGNPK